MAIVCPLCPQDACCHFKPLSPDPYIIKPADMTPAKFGHLNHLVDIICCISNEVAALQSGSVQSIVYCGTPLQEVLGVVTIPAIVVDGVTITGTGCTGSPLTVVAGAIQSIVYCGSPLAEVLGVVTIPAIAVDGVTITGTGCVGDPLVAVAAAAAIGYAEYVQHTAQAPVAPGTAIEYMNGGFGVYDTIGINIANGPGAIGTAFQLPVGVYMVDYENSADAAWSLAIYQGASNTVLAIDINTISGASTATTWIHGRAIVVVTGLAVDDWIMISPVTGTQAIPTAGTAAGEFIARVTFLKIG